MNKEIRKAIREGGINPMLIKICNSSAKQKQESFAPEASHSERSK